MTLFGEVSVSLIYLIVTLSVVFSIASVIFAYRLSRVTGLFSAWILQIVGLILVAFEDFIYFGSIVLSDPAQMQATAQSLSAGSLLFVSVIVLGTPLAFFLAMYKMYNMFKSQNEKSAEPISASIEPLSQ